MEHARGSSSAREVERLKASYAGLGFRVLGYVIL